MTKVTKAVIAAAGFGTRFLPQTKAMPKEMLPLIDKPIIQYIVEDLVAAGIQDIIIVGSSNKRAIEDHFDMPSEDLLNNLRAGGPKKQHYIDEVEAIAGLANFVYLRQKGPYGNATPIMNAAHLIGNEPFIYAFADDLTVATPNAFQQMIALYDEFQASILPCLRITEHQDYDRYGVLAGNPVRGGVLKMTSIIEKPGKDRAPSDFASVGGYLFTPEVFQYMEDGLRNLPEGKEFYVTDSLVQPMLADGHAFFGCEIQNSQRYDTGDKLEYLKTVIDFGLKHEELGPALRQYLASKLGN
ncbi:MAG TPA: UTP--glucose-1-phosphate uridylyltransferase [Candidatus Saccharimonadales bacterium]|nr:UTP--glucose-1-phosphate uridylyltransferase [Candidatus Saccharimonadales bacterium]